MVTFREAFIAKEKVAKKLLQQKDVFAVGVGYHNPKSPNSGAGIILYKLPGVRITSTPNQVSIKVNGNDISVPMRVVENKNFHANVNNNANGLSKRIRPVIAGYSIGTPKWSGTTGLIVTDYQKKKLYVCSNNHVLNNNNSSGYTETIQPGGADTGKTIKDRIGNLSSYVKLNKGINYLDAGLSSPLKNNLLYPSYEKIGLIRGHYANYGIGWRFIKVGRTSGLVGGVVDSIHTDVKVNYGDYGGLGTILFKNQTIIKSNQPISLPGDSGSVWLHHKNYFATAINYAGTSDGKISVSYPIHWYMQAFHTQVALPDNKNSYVLKVKNSQNSSYTQPLTNSELKAIQVVHTK